MEELRYAKVRHVLNKCLAEMEECELTIYERKAVVLALEGFHGMEPCNAPAPGATND